MDDAIALAKTEVKYSDMSRLKETQHPARNPVSSFHLANEITH
jgi:hypothetical protein